MTEKFDVTQFTLALPRKRMKSTGELLPMFDYIGVENGEHCWAMLLGLGKIRILIRSSINSKTNVSDGTGENSIRLIVQRKKEDKWFAIGKGPDAYTQRTKGWEQRLLQKIKILYKQWSPVKQDFTDSENLFLSRQPNSKGRVFAKHTVTGGFRWLS